MPNQSIYKAICEYSCPQKTRAMSRIILHNKKRVSDGICHAYHGTKRGQCAESVRTAPAAFEQYLKGSLPADSAVCACEFSLRPQGILSRQLPLPPCVIL